MVLGCLFVEVVGFEGKRMFWLQEFLGPLDMSLIRCDFGKTLRNFQSSKTPFLLMEFGILTDKRDFFKITPQSLGGNLINWLVDFISTSILVIILGTSNLHFISKGRNRFDSVLKKVIKIQFKKRS